MDAVKRVISREAAAIGLVSIFSKRKAQNADLLNPFESRDGTPQRWLEKVSRNDPSDTVGEGPPKENARFELTETSAECSWDLSRSNTGRKANKYMGNFVSNQTLTNKTMSFNSVPENFKKK